MGGTRKNVCHTLQGRKNLSVQLLCSCKAEKNLCPRFYGAQKSMYPVLFCSGPYKINFAWPLMTPKFCTVSCQSCRAIFINVGHILSAPNFSPLKYKDKVDIKFLFWRINFQTIVFPSRYLPVRKCVLESIH